MSGNSLSRSEIDGKLRDLDSKLDTLRRNYEQFFVGSRDRPPRNERRQVDRLVRELEQASVTNTSQRFRLRSLIQRYNSYKQKWNRVQRQIEQGTYAPHKRKARRRQKAREEAEAKTGGTQSSESDDGPNDDAVEIDAGEFGDLDLEGLQKELEQMDQEGEFEKYVETERMGAADFEEAERQKQQQQRQDAPRRGQGGGEAGHSDQSKRPRRPESDGGQRRGRGGQTEQPQRGGSQDSGDTSRKREKIRELQNKLGLSGGSDKTSKRKGKLEEMRRKLEKGGGADQQSDSNKRPSQQRRNRKSSRKERSNRESTRESQRKKKSSQRRRIIDRSSSRSRSSSGDGSRDSNSDDDDETQAFRVYRRLIEAKHEYEEDTDELSFDAVWQSMEIQRRRLWDQGYDQPIDFRVVVKNDRVFLQPHLLGD